MKKPFKYILGLLIGIFLAILAGIATVTLVTASAPGYNVAEALASAPTINIDKGLNIPSPDASAYCVSGTLMKLPNDGNPYTQADATIYFCGIDGSRYAFPDAGTYFSWYKDFSGVRIVNAETLAALPLGGNVTYRPGSRLLKVESDPEVYAIAKGGVLRWVTSEEVARALYGNDWNRSISDIPVALFNGSYLIGGQINLADAIPGSATAAPGCTTTTVFTSYLILESTDLQVRPLQELLQCLGYFPADIAPTGYFGPVTENSVKEFQSMNGISPVGYVGTMTREALNHYTAK